MKHKNIDFGYSCEVLNYNSNNDWGFGGSIGQKYIFNENLYVNVGKACFRHLPSHSHITLWYENRRDLDLAGHSEKNVELIKQRLKELING